MVTVLLICIALTKTSIRGIHYQKTERNIENDRPSDGIIDGAKANKFSEQHTPRLQRKISESIDKREQLNAKNQGGLLENVKRLYGRDNFKDGELAAGNEKGLGGVGSEDSRDGVRCRDMERNGTAYKVEIPEKLQEWDRDPAEGKQLSFKDLLKQANPDVVIRGYQTKFKPGDKTNEKGGRGKSNESALDRAGSIKSSDDVHIGSEKQNGHGREDRLPERLPTGDIKPIGGDLEDGRGTISSEIIETGGSAGEKSTKAGKGKRAVGKKNVKAEEVKPTNPGGHLEDELSQSAKNDTRKNRDNNIGLPLEENNDTKPSGKNGLSGGKPAGGGNGKGLHGIRNRHAKVDSTPEKCGAATRTSDGIQQGLLSQEHGSRKESVKCNSKADKGADGVGKKPKHPTLQLIDFYSESFKKPLDSWYYCGYNVVYMLNKRRFYGR